MFSLTLTKKQYDYYYYVTAAIQLLYFLLLIGFSLVNINYVRYAIISIHTIICLFLLIKFNRFIDGNVDINIYEKKFIFNGSLILLINILIYEFGVLTFIQNQNIKIKIDAFVEKVKEKIRNILN